MRIVSGRSARKRCGAPALLAVLTVAVTAPAAGRAQTVACAQTTPAATGGPSAGSPCWTDVTPYPFGADGNAVDSSSPACGADTVDVGTPNWGGDFMAPSCYLVVTSMAFRAWNRGLAATSGSNAFGVWLYNGSSWYPDPTFPGRSVCPGNTLIWAGKLDYWLVGSADDPTQTLCRFDGVGLVWEPLQLPSGTLAKLRVDPVTGTPNGGVTTGACYAWDDCWFFGDDGIAVHWDGQELSDMPVGVGPSPWLQGDYTGAVAGSDTAGQAFGFAIARSTYLGVAGGVLVTSAVPSRPDGSPPPQVYSSTGGPFAPLPYAPPGSAGRSDAYPTDLVAVSANPAGAVWAAGYPNGLPGNTSTAAPLLRLNEQGAAASCSGYDTATLSKTTIGSWNELAVSPIDGSVLAAVTYVGPQGPEPAIVNATCGRAPAVTRFEQADPFTQAGQPVPADLLGFASAVASNAANDAWAATTAGQLTSPLVNGISHAANTRPHLYHWTDGKTPAAPAGDDNEPRPSLFTLDPPVYAPAPPTTVITITSPVKTQHGRTRTRKEPPSVYGLRVRAPRAHGSGFLLDITFRVRRPVSFGIEALRGGRVVARSGIHHFTGRAGTLALLLERDRWPTRLKLVYPATGRSADV